MNTVEKNCKFWKCLRDWSSCGFFPLNNYVLLKTDILQLDRISANIALIAHI